MLRHSASIIGVSISTWLVACSASISWFLYALIKWDRILGVSIGINTLTSLSMIITVLMVRRGVPDDTAQPTSVTPTHLEPLVE